MGRPSREKGKRGERELAKLWAPALPGVDVRRTGQDQAHQALGQKPSDVKAGIHHIEGKRRKKMTLNVVRDGVAQAVDDADPDQIPVCCWRSDGEGWYATLRLEDYLRLVNEHHTGGTRAEQATGRTPEED